jgi:hypothetical protein
MQTEKTGYRGTQAREIGFYFETEDLAARLGMTVQEFIRGIENLQAAGLLKVYRTSGETGAIYRICGGEI